MAQHEASQEPAVTVALPSTAADMVPLGIIKTDSEGRFTYANRTMLQMAGLQDWRGRTFREFFQGDSLQTVLEEFKSRFEKRAANDYPVDLTRADGKIVPVRITAFPQTNAADVVVGTLALVRDLTAEQAKNRMEQAKNRMYKLVEQESDSDKLLDAITATLSPLVPFDRFQVIRLNQGRTHLRTIYPHSLEEGAAARTYRWWQIPQGIRHMLDIKEPFVINDLLAWYRQPENAFMLKNKAVQQFLAEGFVSTMSLPVSQGNQQVASIVLSRKQGRPFTDEEIEVADALPLTEAVSVALRNETEGNLNFLLALMRDISSAYDSVRTVAQSIVGKISDHYGWDYVSIYQVYEKRGENGEIHLIAQHARREELLSKRASLSLSEGIVGYVFRNKEGVNIGDIANDPVFSTIAVAHSGVTTASEVCVPVGADSRWLLNVEDELTDAFAQEEMADLQAIAGGLNSLLKRTLDFHYRSAIFGSANDAMLLVDERGMVVECNTAAQRLLGIPKDMINQRPIEEFFADALDAKALLLGKSFLNDEVLMLSGAAGMRRERLKVLLSVAALPDEIGGRIFIASDMKQVDRVAQLELSQGLYMEVTGQVKTPMSLAISWLRRHAKKNELGPDDVARKVMQQLERAELTLDRMMLAETGEKSDARHEVLIAIDDLVDNIRSDMPAVERDIVDIRGSAKGVFVRGDPYELRYCLQTVLSYLLRLAAEVDRIELEVRRHENEILLTATGRAESHLHVQDLDTACRSGQVRAELSLGSETLDRLARRNRGRYAESASAASGRVSFGFSFPVETEGATA